MKQASKKSRIETIMRYAVGMTYRKLDELLYSGIAEGVAYRFMEMNGKKTGTNSDSVRGVLLFYENAEGIIYRCEIGE